MLTMELPWLDKSAVSRQRQRRALYTPRTFRKCKNRKYTRRQQEENAP